MSTIVNDFTQKNSTIFSCELCDFTSCNKNDFTRHIKTKKHIINQNQPKSTENTLKNSTPICGCICGKIYKEKTGLWRHKQKCEFLVEQPIVVINEPSDKDVIMLLIKQNSELIKEHSDIKQIILDLVKNGTNTTNNTINNSNSHNKAFNLNFFLNETCKNAMNITEFVDSIQWELEDLMELGEIGYVASMSKIITKKLNALDETVRPIHCADKKREIFYIKDEDKWEKEDEEFKRLRKIILRLSNKSMKLLPKYREKFPDYDDAKSIRSDELCKIIIEAVTCDSAKDEKIIRNISKATMISKEALQVV
jgi:hypothetical protein